MRIKDDIELEIVQCNIVEEKVDAIVSPVDSELSFKGGLSKNVMSQAGQRMQQEISFKKNQWNNRPLDVCAAFVTEGGNLEAKNVILVVTPIHYSFDTPQFNHNLIEICVLNALQLAMHRQAKTVCIPSISTGGACFPMDIVATLTIDTAANWASLNDTGSVKHIKICNFNGEEYETYKRVFNQIKVRM